MRFITARTAAALLTALLATLLSACQSDGDQVSPVAVDTSVAGDPDAVAVSRLLADISSDEDLERALAPGAWEALGPDGVDGAIPAGARFLADTDSWVRTGNIGEITATLQHDAGEDRFRITVIPNDSGQWDILMTELLP